ncbi:anthranilate synthase component I family protein [Sulfoacidibacillus thermotolerans]|uniref:Anthranilate synthase component I n=1 Tax=Sulfoacidibacillus thermotolerans TaxID=1765684 RepID=A0A2U3D8Y3_SULT2|nr:anthranilate synthase component I family protein [Sulfoacidibacillus thermotolerans]PWI57742.1 anthranilate synthase component I [Sulfoacidibacillus thermotolerans]
MKMQVHAVVPVRTKRFELTTQAEAFSFFVAFVREYGEEQAFLLDSVTDSKKEYCSSMIGLFPILTVRAKGEKLTVSGHEAVLSILQPDAEQKIQYNLSQHLDGILHSFDVEENLPAYAFGYLGFFGYDSIRYFEKIPNTTTDDREIDDFHLQIHRIVLHMTPEQTVIYVHEIEGVKGPGIADVERLLHFAASEPLSFKGYDRSHLISREDVSFDVYRERVERIKEYIRAGDVFQCVISKRLRVEGEIDTLEVYGRLRKMNPSPYMFYAHYGSYLIFGASPEMQLRVQDQVVQMRPIAGTSKGKGLTPDENQLLIDALQNDPKERAEHVMLVDLCRNDIGRIAVPGSVRVEQLLQIEEYSHVYHLVSLVTAKIQAGVSPFDVFLSTFPAGTLSGAPKVRAMEIIDELEDVNRGPYGGIIGMFDIQGNVDTAIIIRTVVHQDGVSYLQAGAGIVADSDPVLEWRECDHKLGALRATIYNEGT